MTKHSVLVIDDEPDMREMLAFDLSETYEVDKAESGKEAIERAMDRRFDVAILDLRMPGMSGQETLAALKKIDPAMQVVIATAYSSIETASECMRSGACAYIQKPYSLDKLKDLMELAVGKRKADRIAILVSESGMIVKEGICSSDPVGSFLDGICKVLSADRAGLFVMSGEGWKALGNPVFPESMVKPAVQKAMEFGGCARYPSPEFRNAHFLEGSGFGSMLAYVIDTPEEGKAALLVLRSAGSGLFTPAEVELGRIPLACTALLAANYYQKNRKTVAG